MRLLSDGSLELVEAPPSLYLLDFGRTIVIIAPFTRRQVRFSQLAINYGTRNRSVLWRNFVSRESLLVL